MGGWVGEGWVDGWMSGYEVYELIKKKVKITLSFTSPEKEFFIYIHL
jgi:hypothetical protein